MTARSLIQAIHVVGAAIIADGRCLIAKRGPAMRMPGKWEFPGGKIEPGETAEDALARELREELGLHAAIGAWLGRGESIDEHGRAIRLDVYAATADCAALRPNEHEAVAWIGAEAIHEPDWADADVPVLPAVRAALTEEPAAHRCPEPVTLIAADWSLDVKKRAVYAAERHAGWSIERRECDGGFTVPKLLEIAAETRRRTGCGVLVGIDVSLGIPTALGRRGGKTPFLEFLQNLEQTGGLDTETSTAEAWRPEQPFFRIPAGPGGKTRYMAAAGGETTLLRQIEIRTGANPTFALSGIPGTVGSGSRAVWRELAPLLRAPRRPGGFRVWPYEGPLSRLVAEGRVVVAEIYPRAAYAVALADTLPAPLQSIPKTKRSARAAALERLAHARWLRTTRTKLPDLAPAEANEDDFDALLTVTAMVRTVAEQRPMACALVDPIAEGGLLATGDVSLPDAPYHRRRRPKPEG